MFKIVVNQTNVNFFAKNHKYYVKIKIGKKKSGNFVYILPAILKIFFQVKKLTFGSAPRISVCTV